MLRKLPFYNDIEQIRDNIKFLFTGVENIDFVLNRNHSGLLGEINQFHATGLFL